MQEPCRRRRRRRRVGRLRGGRGACRRCGTQVSRARGDGGPPWQPCPWIRIVCLRRLSGRERWRR
eukprot:11360448-Alexandrium_andersonii.AAC.1